MPYAARPYIHQMCSAMISSGAQRSHVSRAALHVPIINLILKPLSAMGRELRCLK
jgi:hypothetical protein